MSVFEEYGAFNIQLLPLCKANITIYSPEAGNVTRGLSEGN